MSLPEESQNDFKTTADDAAKQSSLMQILDPQARTRLGNIRLVKPDLATNVENYLLGLAAQGRISQVSDEQLKQILLSLQQPKRNFKFSRV
ncbi:MAG: DNA-binding protein [Cenarchaeum symbiont of Oopsacas minuta]|nr:DNA-binding protein [Cenarchaeum symbiont of Oopsacas minuta]